MSGSGTTNTLSCRFVMPVFRRMMSVSVDALQPGQFVARQVAVSGEPEAVAVAQLGELINQGRGHQRAHGRARQVIFGQRADPGVDVLTLP